MLRRVLCLTVLLAAAGAAGPAAAVAAPRPPQPLDRPLVADLDGDGTNETVRLRETACFSSGGESTPPCPNRDDVFRSIVVEVADTCGGGKRVLTLSREMDSVTFARLLDADRDGKARELAFELRAGASGRGVQSKIVSFRAGSDGCVAVRRTLFSYPQPQTIGKRPRGTSFSTGGLDIRNFSSRHPGSELRTMETYVRGNDPGCCPSYERTTYWRFAPKSGSYTPYRTKLRKLR